MPILVRAANMSLKFPNATVAGIAAATPWKNLPMYTPATEGTAAVMMEKMQKRKLPTM